MSIILNSFHILFFVERYHKGGLHTNRGTTNKPPSPPILPTYPQSPPWFTSQQMFFNPNPTPISHKKQVQSHTSNKNPNKIVHHRIHLCQ